ncbi:MAG: CDP-alcohol phosphatidyltransferase family protein [bacterium]|nr:CDP-alcohol phosphatidyltransferase family protein [bacterium]
MEKSVNIPNALSALRLLLFPIIFWLIMYSNEANYPYLLFVFFFSIALDFIDGYLARKLRQETELGKILDPVADKLLVFFVVLALIIRTDFPIWLGVIIFLRDSLILTASAKLMKEKNKVQPSILIGKIAFGIFGTLILIYLLDLHHSMQLHVLKRFFIVITVGFLAWSFVEYLNVYKKEKNA